MKWGVGKMSVHNPTKHQFVAAFGRSPAHIPGLPAMAPGTWTKLYGGETYTEQHDRWNVTVAESDSIIDFRVVLN